MAAETFTYSPKRLIAGADPDVVGRSHPAVPVFTQTGEQPVEAKNRQRDEAVDPGKETGKPNAGGKP